MNNSESAKSNKKVLVGVICGILALVVIILLLLKGCQAKEYTIKFDSDGGTTIESIKVKENEKVTRPEDPTKDGYTFDAWYYENEVYDFDTKVTKDMTLKAHWKDGIKLNSTEMSLAIGSTGKIEILSLPDGTKESDLIYSSSNEELVTVDKDGNLKAIKAGNVTITIKSKDGKYTAKCIVTVTEEKIEIESISIEGASTVTIGSSIKLTATFNPSNATSEKLTWKSSNNSIATVDENGTVRGLKAGEVTIIVQTESGKVAKHTITVKAKSTSQNNNNPSKPQEVTPTGVSISGLTEVYVGNTINLTATVSPSNAANKSVKWSSSNNSIATVDGNGKVTGVSSGTVTITATTSNGKATTYEITVKDSFVIYLTKRELALVGGALQYDFKVEKNGVEFTDYLGFTYNNTKVSRGQGTVSATTVENGGNTARLKLSNKQEVTATVVIK